MQQNLVNEEEEALLGSFTREPLQPSVSVSQSVRDKRHLLLRVPKQVHVFLITYFLLYVAGVIAAPSGLDVLYKIVCSGLSVPDDTCSSNHDATVLVTSYLSYTSILAGIMGFTVNPVLLTWSDKVGRKRVMSICLLILNGFQVISWYMVFGLPKPANLWIILLIDTLANLGGGVPLLSSLSTAYISDLVTNAEDRAKVLSLVDSTTTIALAIAPLLGSQIVAWYGVSILNLVAIALIFVATFVIMIFVPESLSAEVRNRNIESGKINWREVRDLVFFNKVVDPISRRNSRLFLVCSMFGMEFFLAATNVTLVYVKSTFGWTAVELGRYMSVTSGTKSFVYLLGFSALYSFLRNRWTVYDHEVDRIDVTILQIGLLTLGLGISGMVISTTSEGFLASSVLEALSSVGGPIMKSTLLKSVPQSEIGSFMAGFGFLNSVIIMALPPVMLYTYEMSLEFLPSMPFVITASIVLGLFFTSFIIRPRI